MSERERWEEGTGRHGRHEAGGRGRCADRAVEERARARWPPQFVLSAARRRDWTLEGERGTGAGSSASPVGGRGLIRVAMLLGDIFCH